MINLQQIRAAYDAIRASDMIRAATGREANSLLLPDGIIPELRARGLKPTPHKSGWYSWGRLRDIIPELLLDGELLTHGC